MDDSDPDRLVGSLLTASRALVGVSAQSLAAVEDRVTLSQFRTLVVLESHGPSPLHRLADRLGVGPSTALRAVDRLIDGGYVQRRESEHDRREVVIEASQQGARLVHEVTAIRRTAIERIVRDVPAARRGDLIAALEAFAEAAGEPAVRDAATPLGW